MVTSTRWRLRFTSNGGDIRVGAAGLEFRNSADGPVLSTGGTPTASSTSGFGGPVANLFDASAATEWLAEGVVGQWVEYATPTAVEINHVTVMTVGSTPYYTTLGPRSFEVQAFVGSAWVTQWTSGNIFYDVPNAVRTVSNPLARIGASFPIAWNTAAAYERLAVSFPTSWNTAAAYERLAVSFPISWNTEAAHARIAQSFPIAWNIEDQADRIAVSFPIAWDIEAQPVRLAVSFPIAWNIEQSFADLSRMVVPDYPITEVWNYQTSIFRSENGNEQRRARVVRPVVTLQFTAPSFEPIDFWTTRRVMEIDTVDLYPVPMFQYYAYLTAPAFIGDTRIYFDTGRANLVPGQYVTFLSEDGDPVLVAVTDIHDDGVTIAEALSINLIDSYFACPILFSRVSDNGETEHSPVHAYSSYSFVSADRELDFVRPDNVEVLPTLGGIPLLSKYIRANDNIAETYINGSVAIDNARANPVVFHNEPTRRAFELVYLASRENSPVHLDFWRRFFDTIRGAQKAFALPTFRPDAYPDTPVQAGDTEITLIGRDFFDVFNRGGYMGLAFGVQALALECAHVVAVDLVGGNSVCTLDAPIVGTGYDVASFVMRMRASDTIVLEHDDVNTLLRFSVQMVQK